LTTNTQLSCVNLRSSCPILKSEILDILFSNDTIYILTDDWFLFCWGLTNQTYNDRIQICNSDESVNISKIYKNRFNDKFPIYLSDSKDEIIVNSSSNNNKILIINKETFCVKNVI
jgi:hypothetical protein